MLFTILLVILVVFLVGSLLNSRDWGYYPSGGVGLLLVVLLILFLLGVFK